MVSGIRNSLLVSACSAALSVYFSALTAYGIYAYNFKFKKAAFALILLIMTMPTQVSALGFLQLIPDRSQHCSTYRVLLHEAVSGRFPSHGDRGSRPH